MKKLLLLSLLSITFVKSQSRVNPDKELKIGDIEFWLKSGEVSGWDFDKGEEWKERDGYLRVGYTGILDICEKYNESVSICKSHTDQNFNEIGVVSVWYNDVEYVGLAVEKTLGRYKYPALKMDWYTYKLYNIYLFESFELEKLKDLNGEVDLQVFIGAYSTESYQGCYDDLRYIFKNGDSDVEFLKFKNTSDGDKEVVRFLLTQKTNSYTDSELINFDEHYFEVTKDKFKSLTSKIFKDIREGKIKID